jgi:hypothetical protein
MNDNTKINPLRQLLTHHQLKELFNATLYNLFHLQQNKRLLCNSLACSIGIFQLRFYGNCIFQSNPVMFLVALSKQIPAKTMSFWVTLASAWYFS